VEGWKIDEVMMNIFQQCWTAMSKLHTIKYAVHFVMCCVLFHCRCRVENQKFFGNFFCHAVFIHIMVAVKRLNFICIELKV